MILSKPLRLTNSYCRLWENLRAIRIKEWRHIRCYSSGDQNQGIHANLSVKDGVAVIRLMSPGKVNVLGTGLGHELEPLLKEFSTSPSIKSGILISDKPHCFIAGADINLISSLKSKEEVADQCRRLQVTLNGLEASTKPMVAAIMGTCLGGGLEVALACHYRLAVAQKSTFAFPEVMLGLLPGAGGTQRLPKLIGVPNSLDMMLTGRNIRSEKAKAMGLVDKLVHPLGPGLNTADETTLSYLEEVAFPIAKSIEQGKLKIKRNPQLSHRIMDKAVKYNFVKDYIFKQAKDKVMKQTHGLYPAPLRILDVVRTGLDKGQALGYQEEAAGFGDLAMSKESKGLISLFHGQTECKKNKYKKSMKKTENIAVVGAGLMGAGIAQVSSMKGMNTILKDTNQMGLVRGVKQIQSGYQESVKKKKMSQLESERNYSRMVSTLEYNGFEKCDMVIEAIVEDITIKKKVLSDIENIIPEDCIFATNTSALPVKDIAAASKRPENVIGMHYFSPVDKMQLLEIIRTDATSEDTVSRAVEIGLRQGKIPVVVADSPGFYTTRIMGPLMDQAFLMILQGVDPVEFDNATVKFGFPIGLATLTDEIGIEVSRHVQKSLRAAFGERIISISLELGDDMIEAGFLGRKVGKGTYIYKKGSPKVVNSEAMALIERKYRIQPKIPNTIETMQLMPISRMVNEAVMCLEEGVIQNPLEGDIAAVFGLGFPPFTGGPFHFVDAYGAKKLVDTMRRYEQHYGSTFTPCQLLLDHAKDQSKRFFSN